MYFLSYIMGAFSCKKKLTTKKNIKSLKTNKQITHPTYIVKNINLALYNPSHNNAVVTTKKDGKNG